VLKYAQEYLPSAQVKAAAAHVQILKQNQRKKKFESDLYGIFGYLIMTTRCTIGLFKSDESSQFMACG
jgi:lipid-A-disaccharide synthase-like uncharacterized protein